MRLLCEGVALRWQPVHRRWDVPLLASSLSTGTCSKTACVQPSMMECGLAVHQGYSMLAVCPQCCVTCSTDGGMSVAHTLLFVQKVTRPSYETGSPSLHAASTRRRAAIITDQLLPATRHVHARKPGAKDIPLTFPSCRTQ